MKKFKNFGILGVALGILVINYAYAAKETLGDYLVDKGVSFMLIHTEADVLLATFGGQSATESCKTITEAGFEVTHIRNYAEETHLATNAVCEN